MYNRLELVSIIENLKFKRRLFGGYDKISVMQQIEKLNLNYQKLLEEEKIKHEAIMGEKNKEIEALKEKNNGFVT